MDEETAFPIYIQGLIKSNEQINAWDEFTKHLMGKYSFATTHDTNDIYFWNGSGIFQEYGESLIKKEFEHNFGRESKTHFFNEIKFRIEAKTQINRDEFNKDVNIIPVANGLLNIFDYTIEPFNKEKLFTFKIPVIFDVNATCPKIDKFFSEIVRPEDVDTLYEIAGYCLYRRHNIHKSFMLNGEGSNGKSTYVNLLREFLGCDNVISLPIQLLEKNTFIRGKLYGKLANLCPELSGEALYNTGIFKAITGEDAITADKKHKEAFTFKNYSKQIFATNVVPQVKNDDSYAFFRRWCIIDFPNQFEGENANNNLLQELTTPEELSGFLLKAMQGLKRLLEKGNFTTKMSVEECRKAYIRKSDSIRAFVDDCIEPSIEGYTPKDQLYNKYVEFCKKIKLVPKNKDYLLKELPKHVMIEMERIRDGEKRVQVVKGIIIKSLSEEGLVGGQGGQGKTPIVAYTIPVQSYNKENTLTTMDKVDNTPSLVSHNKILIIIREQKDLVSEEFILEQAGAGLDVVRPLLTELSEQGLVYSPKFGFWKATDKGCGVVC